MAFKDKVFGSVGGRAGITVDQARLAVMATIDVLATKISHEAATLLREVLAAENGIPGSTSAPQTKEAVPTGQQIKDAQEKANDQAIQKADVERVQAAQAAAAAEASRTPSTPVVPTTPVVAPTVAPAAPAVEPSVVSVTPDANTAVASTATTENVDQDPGSTNSAGA